MSNINYIIEKYQPEFMKFVTGSVLIFYVIYKQALYNASLFSISSSAERIIALVIIAFVVGELSFQIGDFLTTAISWIAFQRQKKISIAQIKKALGKYMSFGVQSIDDGGAISRAEVLAFLESNPALKLRREEGIRGSIFWKTLLGVSLLTIVFFPHQDETNLIIIFSGICLMLCLYSRLKIARLWHDCALQLRRERLTNLPIHSR